MARQKPTIFLKGCFEEIDSLENEVDMYDFVLEIYLDHEEEENLVRNAKLLHIWRKDPDEWQPPRNSVYL